MANTKVDEDNFYKSAYDWTYDIYHSHSTWLRCSLVGLILLSVLLGLSIVANLFLIPFKEKIPYLYAFDHSTGEITKIGTLEPSTLSANWELSKYLLMQYVINYESYNSENIEQPYQFVWAQSNDNVRKEYESKVNSFNNYSPYKLYGKDKYITVHINSISKLNDNTVDIKFEKILHDRISNSERVSHKEAIVRWTFDKTETSQKMLERDPLGFKVTYYQVTQVNLENT